MESLILRRIIDMRVLRLAILGKSQCFYLRIWSRNSKKSSKRLVIKEAGILARFGYNW